MTVLWRPPVGLGEATYMSIDNPITATRVRVVANKKAILANILIFYIKPHSHPNGFYRGHQWQTYFFTN